MDEELDTLVVRVRGDTQGFARDVEAMRGSLEGPLAAGAARATRAMESSLERFVRTGKFGFEDLKRVAVAALGDIAGQSARVTGGGGLIGALVGAAGTLLGLPGRATGGPVTGGRGYMVGERGPEVFVPNGAGRIEPFDKIRTARGPVNITVNVAVPRETGQPFMARTGSQVARSVRAALMRVDADG